MDFEKIHHFDAASCSDGKIWMILGESCSEGDFLIVSSLAGRLITEICRTSTIDKFVISLNSVDGISREYENLVEILFLHCRASS
jgi:hypothetical protein